MPSYLVEKKENFIGRQYEQQRLQEIEQIPGAKILIVYGRRRVGKTELLEQTFKDRTLLKFEGIENTKPAQQMQFVMRQLAEYAQQDLLAKVNVTDWIDVLQYIAQHTKTGTYTIYFEEIQWLANYQDNFVAALKYVWDNIFRHNSKLIVILCGSSPSFMLNKVIKSRALYNRSQYELPLREFHLIEAKQMLADHSKQEVMDAFLSLGGIPEYLQRLKKKTSIYIDLCKESFLPGAAFCQEYEKIFTSSLADNKHYKQIIAYLSKRKFASRNEILRHLKLTSGGALTTLLEDLILCGFIDKYTPYNLSSNSKVARYNIRDAYLQFYFKFIAPITEQIQNGDFIANPTEALNMTSYQQWLGYAFERFCRKYHRQIATILGFVAVKYQSGTYFSRHTDLQRPGFQIDLLFDRDDNVLSICEIKYTKHKVSAKIIEEFEKKIELMPNKKNKTIHKVLISNHGPDDSLARQHYFDKIITLEDLFDHRLWF